ncbi:hypothetical protein L5515_011584 [Caenorhabditis briggsae]|uniref:C-type lectin domain-containing protein n=2 Tax=Caenorhabditis briggsae TaxID=6238 RepID=A0AAE9EWU2_CAEBR|nr:hypothetical protein L5515_011584 [Caenorhabditis briggsae]
MYLPAIFFFLLFINVSCKPNAKSHDHIEEYLENKTMNDVYEISQQYHRAKYLEVQENEHSKIGGAVLSDAAQPNLVLADATLPCEPNWHQYTPTGCCFRKSDAMSEWYGGTEICRALHPEAQMASFHSQAESEFVCKKYSAIHAWTGLSQTGTPGVWTYTDGTPDWHWFFAQSSTMTPESSCVEMMDGILVLLFSWSAKKGQTQPYTCTESIASICKYCPTTTTTTSTTTSTTTTTPTTTTKITTTPTTTTTTAITTTPTTTTETTTTPTTTTVTTTTPTTTTTTQTTTTETTTTPTTTTETTTTPTTPTTTTITSSTSIKITTSKSAISCTTSNCPAQSVSFNNKCYKMCRGSVQFAESCTLCGGTTVTVTNKEESDFISRVFGENDATISQSWIGNTETSGYLNWADVQPLKPNDGLSYCISIDLSAGPSRGKYNYLQCASNVVSSICVV